jgi:serine/threonine protein kinase
MTRGTHSTVEQAPGIGDALGRYRIIGVLGDGSLGRLYVAEQHGLRGISKTVALRCIRPELARSPRFRARFAEAASVATRCEHPNVLAVFEMDSIDGRYFISMEYLPGESVESVINQCNTRDALTPDTAAYVVKQVATALQYLHDLRERSPQRVSAALDPIDTANVFISYHGTVKWLSTGLRSLAQEFALEADSGSAAPASAATKVSREAAADRHTGVFDLGVLLWTCLVGERPSLVPGPPGTEVAGLNGAGHAASQQSLPAPSSLRAEVPDALDAIVKHAVSSVPREQFTSPHALSDALDRYLLRRESRPTPKHLRRWMEQLFGIERASLQMQIARGRDIEAALARLNAPHHGMPSSSARAFSTPRPRALWSTSQSVFSQLGRASMAPHRSFERIPGSTPDESSHVTSILTRHRPSSFMSAPATLANAELPPRPAPEPGPSRSWLVVTLVAACAVLATGLILIVATSAPSSPVVATRDAKPHDQGARVDVRSRPEGAAVFVDGEPTGLRTPAVLKGLTPGRRIHVRVEKAGFASQEQEIPVVEGTVETRLFELAESGATVRFDGAPPDARIFVDDQLLAEGGAVPIRLSLGSHSVRVETPSALVFSGRVDIVAGEQTIHVGGDRATP